MSIAKLTIGEKTSNQGATAGGRLSAAEFNELAARVNELIDMFDDNFDFSAFDFSGDDIVSKIASIIYESKLKGGEG